MKRIGEQAVVIGASMGGLLAARALADFYRQVTVLERTRFRSRIFRARACRRANTRTACWREAAP
jgi:2-polyprenyl-6-methoxyphenol hydroxylase-like FAD-dependent oxidoreductase